VPSTPRVTVNVRPAAAETSTTSSEAVSGSMIAVNGNWFGYPDKAVTVIEVAELFTEADRVVATAVEE
jgi:hypothetical protein